MIPILFDCTNDDLPEDENKPRPVHHAFAIILHVKKCSNCHLQLGVVTGPYVLLVPHHGDFNRELILMMAAEVDESPLCYNYNGKAKGI